MRKAIIIPGFLALAACGGGGGGSTVIGGSPTLTSYIETTDRLAGAILASVGSEDGAQAGLGSSASFTGVMVFDRQRNAPSEAYYGAMTATANFNSPTETLSGEATNFIRYNDATPQVNATAVGGTVTFTGTISYDDTNTAGRDPFPITVAGSLELGGTSRNVLSSDFASQADYGVAFAGDDLDSTGEVNPTAENINYFLGLGETTFEVEGTFDTLLLGERQP